MRIDVVTLFPEMIAAVSDYGVISRAVAAGLLSVDCWNPRDFASDRHRSVDDRPYGGGPGMLMTPEPLAMTIDAVRAARRDCESRVVLMTPQGKALRNDDAVRLSHQTGLILVAGRYEGIDERLIQSRVDEEISLGDFVLSGGEIAAMAVIDAVSRQLPGVLGHEQSAQYDSFAAGLLEGPQYTRPEEFEGQGVPSVLLSGDHEAIRRWRMKQALARTYERRPDLLEVMELTPQQKELLADYIREQN